MRLPALDERRELGISLTLFDVPAPKLAVFCRIIAKPLKQLGSWSNLFCPLTQSSFLFADAPWPEPVDEDSVVVLGARRSVHELRHVYSHDGLAEWWSDFPSLTYDFLARPPITSSIDVSV